MTAINNLSQIYIYNPLRGKLRVSKANSRRSTNGISVKRGLCVILIFTIRSLFVQIKTGESFFSHQSTNSSLEMVTHSRCLIWDVMLIHISISSFGSCVCDFGFVGTKRQSERKRTLIWVNRNRLGWREMWNRKCPVVIMNYLEVSKEKLSVACLKVFFFFFQFPPSLSSL